MPMARLLPAPTSKTEESSPPLARQSREISGGLCLQREFLFQAVSFPPASISSTRPAGPCQTDPSPCAQSPSASSRAIPARSRRAASISRVLLLGPRECSPVATRPHALAPRIPWNTANPPPDIHNSRRQSSRRDPLGRPAFVARTVSQEC